MNIQYASDLHLEFPENAKYILDNPLVPSAEILVLAGDVVPFAIMDRCKDFFSHLSDNFQEVYWVPGNHEYYHSDITDRCGHLMERIRSNVFLVNDAEVIIDDHKLVFSTLWSRIGEEKRWKIPPRMSDFQVIRYNGGTLTTHHYNNLHEQSLRFVSQSLSQDDGLKTVVVSHHVPTLRNYPPEFLGTLLNEAFATDLDGLIEQLRPDYWIYGHHHRNTERFKIGNTHMLTNQLGYLHHGEANGFSPRKTID